MESFRTELENPVVQRDILDLEKKIKMYRDGLIPDEKFRSLRLVRGIYGQRQQGVQMVRIKLPFGRVTVKQLLRLADLTDEYATGNLHLTTRQDIQFHFVSLDRTPELWTLLEQDELTIREACGNTVRNVTASATAGIDPAEPFDVSPYADSTFRYFLRNPVCQDLGRKFKISFSSSDQDTAFAFIHDLGFIPKVKVVDGQEVRGFKVMLAGGLGAQPYLAHLAYDFLPEDQLIPFTESVLRVFDRYGERNRRHKARLKFLLEEVGFEEFMRLVEAERIAIKVKQVNINREAVPQPATPPLGPVPEVAIADEKKYQAWRKTNVFEQKQKGFYAVQVKVQLGDLSSATARLLAPVVEKYAADDMRVTVNQGLLLKYVHPGYLPALFEELDRIGLAEPGFDSTADITACPGTDTCNLGISNSTAISVELERVMNEEFPDLIYNTDIKIKISGCINACGQHGLAQIGFHGSSSKAKKTGAVVPALQVMLGGGRLGDGEGRIADKIIKVPSRRGPEVLRYLFTDYERHAQDGEYFNNYYDRQGKDYFYQMLKPLANLENLTPMDFIDWGQSDSFHTAIGVGECAGVQIDLIATLLFESEEKISWAKENYGNGAWADSIYYSYSTFVSTAKAWLLTQEINCNTQHGIISDFDKHAVQTGLVPLSGDFKTLVMQINANEPGEAFARKYLGEATDFLKTIFSIRLKQQAPYAEAHSS
jgi:sulfite reductase (ferredoxin)